MYDQKVFRWLIGITLFIALGIYHITNLLITDYWAARNDAFGLIKLSQIALITLFVLIAAYSTKFAQFVFRNLYRADYIGGCYIGSSGDDGSPKATGSEVFTITQSLFDISISGKTYSIEEPCEWAVWEGRAFKKEGKKLWFGITSMIPRNKPGRPKTEHAMMEIQFDGKRNITGLTYSTSPTEDGCYLYWLNATWQDDEAAQCFDKHKPLYLKRP